jgi:hypothetical protein
MCTYIVSNIYVLYYELHNNAMPIKEKFDIFKYISQLLTTTYIFLPKNQSRIPNYHKLLANLISLVCLFGCFCFLIKTISLLVDQRFYQRWLDKRIYKTEMKFWAVLGSRGCREKTANYHKYATFWFFFFYVFKGKK